MNKLEDIVDKKGGLMPLDDIEFKPMKVTVGADGLPTQPVEDMHIPHEEEQEEEAQIEALEKQEPVAQVKTIPTILNLLNSVLGIGILSVPNSFINTGIIMSFVILVIMAFLSYYATIIVISLQKETSAEGFDDLAFKVLGKAGSVILSILSLLFLFCGLLSFIIVAGDMLLSWFSLAGIDLKSMWKRAALICGYSLVFPICMTIPRSVRFLQYFSTATVVCILFFVVSMIYKCASIVPKRGMDPTCRVYKLDIDCFQTLSIYGLTFSLPVVVLPVIKAYNPDIKKRSMVTIIAIVMCLIIVGITGICGYAIFGDRTDANVLNNFENGDVLIIIVRAAFFIVVTCAYPVVAQSVFGSWSQLIFHVNSSASLPTFKRAIILIIGNGIPIIVAVFLSSAKPALSVGGALGGCIVNFMYPAMLYFKHSQEKYTSWRNILSILLGLFGLVAGVISTYIAVLEAIKAFSK